MIVADIVIDAPAAVVFDFATTPANWPLFWPVTKRVSGDVQKSPPVGAKWTEHVEIAGWAGDFFWHTVSTAPPHTFEMHCWSEGTNWYSRLAGRSNGQIRYFMMTERGATYFLRVMHYTEPNWFMRLIDVLVLRRIMRNNIHAALAKLKTIMETRAPQGSAK